MKLISLAEAVAEIKGACSNTHLAPFFYIVGAGISSPPIPRANEIVQICQEKVEREEGQLPSTAGTAMDEYSFWLRQAYRQPADRPKFLRSLMEGKPLSRANWRLAHLLSAGKIGNVVVTPNFDDMLARALTMLGLPHILCDHPATASRIDEESAEIQILHVHGTYRFYDCCNLSGEIKDRANSLASRMDTLLARRSPLIVGYSGWGKDVIMQAIKRRLEGGQRLPRYLYWFCYSPSTVEDLPLWLRQHQDVCFVVPPEIPTEVIDREVSKIGSPILPASGGFKGSNVHRLAAQTVFDALIKAFEVPAPDITRDPLGFFATS